MFSKFSIGRIAAIAAASATLLTAGAAAAADTRVVVVNSTNHTLTNLYASSVRDSRYHGDWLGDIVLAPGEWTTVDFDDGDGSCLMDVKGHFSDGDNVEQRFNVCTESRMEFTGD